MATLTIPVSEYTAATGHADVMRRPLCQWLKRTRYIEPEWVGGVSIHIPTATIHVDWFPPADVLKGRAR
jgi:hypothetical protein